ncbi:hypothetical protein ACFE04_013389 [Oxalis oulophora]
MTDKNGTKPPNSKFGLLCHAGFQNSNEEETAGSSLGEMGKEDSDKREMQSVVRDGAEIVVQESQIFGISRDMIKVNEEGIISHVGPSPLIGAIPISSGSRSKIIEVGLKRTRSPEPGEDQSSHPSFIANRTRTRNLNIKICSNYICNDPRTKAAVFADMDAIGKEAQLRGFEFAKAVTLVLEPFTLENDLLTPTFKIKRPQAKEYFANAISDMYTQLAKSESSPRQKL